MHKGQYRVISFAGDYVFLKEGNEATASPKDTIFVLWNNDISGVMPLHTLQNYCSLLNHPLTIEL